ncbi:protein mono-ADP-ribosyltransferase PARP9 isoform X1 [Trichechus manatus latirostris]|uniref:Protein mono-ADP-ribosyltransferase PARP9 isoform X1 n=1 Tax=Trichechus manatus latirostris TaxID=127582 RepID=A0A2Y9QZ14_TRIMA|nr:protein mono-ADP-ribosyltransferase PARP9 isoform X1 [Trichechus manatus latirostris]XP_023584578.1 protein mono-ADP-ribosyltransferase PARP9 isoform X1 [Trichechus manatus latirostris]XP_023584579.1 protein mono-ADP-ribosyltransferase PARP9 isoform X1 [Trichechus manatus latirostris]XP_023584580.1 protein mono-ADP-ribosyltransferase PARP9 isoform X1 [Trichechus manatus latirostris]XP_023584581.1 protein mono-ADP-ribosyltransferase PARP9 isoform X1 [Trichechus manatus latirostris]XP_0235845
MNSSKGAGAAASDEKPGRIASLSLLFQKSFAQILPQWKKGNTEGECLPHKCSGIDTLNENYSWQISVTDNDFKIFKNHESQLCEILQDKFDCISTVVSPALEGHIKSLQVFRKMLTSQVALSVWKDDLTRHVVDAVVNAANEHLQHMGGLALALVKAGGPEIEEDSRRFIGRYGKVPTSRIAITRAGRLPCKEIIHAVGPQWIARDGQRCVEELKMAIINILEYVNCTNLDIKAVAIPALSSGIFQFPLDLCTRIIVSTIKLYFIKKQVVGNLKEIHLVSNEDPTVAAFKTASENILGRNQLESLAFSAEMAENKSMLPSHNSFSVSQWTREEKRENGLKANSPAINLMGSNMEKMREAEAWIHRLLKLQGHHVIENNHIFYLGTKEHDILSRLQKTSSVSISEIIDSGKAKLEIKGARADLIEVVMKIEHVLCDIQEEMAKRREQDLWSLLGQWTGQQPKKQDEMKGNSNRVKFPVMFSTQALQDKKKQFEKCGFQVIKVEKINNEVLNTVFQAKKKMMAGRSRNVLVSHGLFHRVPHQFCNMVCRVGFQRMYQMPCESRYGAGIYFTKNLKNLADQIRKTPATDKLIYVFEADVLTGSFCQSCQLNIVPPPLSPGAIDGYDSVVDNVSSPETFVIFSSTQAVPQYLWTCSQDEVWSRDYSSGQMMLSSQSYWG